MKSIKFTVPGSPFGKQRPKFARMGTYTKTYTPKKTTQHEKEVAECFLEVARGRRFKEKEPLDIRIIAYYPIPQSTSKRAAIPQRSGGKKCLSIESDQQ